MISPAERFYIILSSDEKRRWVSGAAEAGQSAGEYFRAAVAARETAPTVEQMWELEAIADEVIAASARMTVMIDEAVTACRRPLDEAAMRARRGPARGGSGGARPGAARLRPLSVSTFNRIVSGLRAVLLLEAEMRRLTEELTALDARERETRERLVYLEGLIACARTRTAQGRLERR